MRTPFKVSLAVSSVVFPAALLAVLFHRNTINGHTLTPMEQLPSALVAAVFFSALALLGTWLGLRKARHVTYLAGMAGAAIYLALTFVAGSIQYSGPQTVTVPSDQAVYLGMKMLALCLVWGIGVPYLVTLLTRRFRF